MERVRNMPRWAKVLGLTGVGIALFALVAKIANDFYGAEFKVSPEEIKEAIQSRGGFDEVFQRLLERRR